MHNGQLDVADLLSPTYGFSQPRVSHGLGQPQRQKRAAKGEKKPDRFPDCCCSSFFLFSHPSYSACIDGCARGSQTGGCHTQLLLPNTLHCPGSLRLLFHSVWMTALGTGPGESISLSHCPAHSHCGCASSAVSGTCAVYNSLLGKYKAGIMLGKN